jgi:hypothetical protein
MDEPSILQRNGETAFAISPDNADQDLRFGIRPPQLILKSQLRRVGTLRFAHPT